MPPSSARMSLLQANFWLAAEAGGYHGISDYMRDVALASRAALNS